MLADLATFIPVRQRPVGEVETFTRPRATSSGATRRWRPRTSRTSCCASRAARAGRSSISQVSAGRKNSLRFEVDGSRGALAWDSERHEELWLGHRDRPNEMLLRNPGLLSPEAQARTHLPAGHAEGFADTFRELYRAVYTRGRGGRPAGRARLPDVRRRARGERARRRDRRVSEPWTDDGWR